MSFRDEIGSFVDEVHIYLKAGNGGDGIASFRHEKFIEFGGPNGGDGGKGGDIIFSTTENLNTLIDFRYKQHYKAENGSKGQKACATGASGVDIVLKVPIGTQIFNKETGELIIDLDRKDVNYIIAKGGKGGLGNTRFKSSTNRAPRKYTLGEIGDELWVSLKLKIFSDIGIIGLPNAGKSSFLSKVTSANTKIAPYPFTTIKPHLGVMKIHDVGIVIADIPGLIEGASDGKGLGHSFLKHIERCRALMHIIDCSSPDIAEDYQTVISEIEKYNEDLIKKEKILVLNKCDLLTKDEIDEKIRHLFSQIGEQQVFLCSMISGDGISEILSAIYELYSKIQKTMDIQSDQSKEGIIDSEEG